MGAEVGTIYEGKVTGLTDFGAFVEFDGGKVGMVHISEVAQTFVKNIRDHLSVNQAVKVKVIGISDNGKINLSIKAALGTAPAEERREKPVRTSRPQPQVWQGSKSAQSEPQSFEEMMARFKQISDEKITDLKRAESKHGGYSRKQ